MCLGVDLLNVCLYVDAILTTKSSKSLTVISALLALVVNFAIWGTARRCLHTERMQVLVFKKFCCFWFNLQGAHLGGERLAAGTGGLNKPADIAQIRTDKFVNQDSGSGNRKEGSYTRDFRGTGAFMIH